MKLKRHLGLFGIVLLAVFGLAACTEVSSAYGVAYGGQTLAITVVTIDRAPELRYTNVIDQSGPRYWLLEPSEDDFELVVVHLTVANHTAPSWTLTERRPNYVTSCPTSTSPLT